MSEGGVSEKAIGGREAAFQAVLEVLRGRFAGDVLRARRAGAELENREAGLALEIALGTVRHLLTIQQVLSAVARFDPRRVRPEARAVLATAAYQIIWMTRVPSFAAVNEAVELARRHLGGREPGMVNAILRRLTGAIATPRVEWQRLNPRQIRVSWDQACEFAREVLLPARTPEQLSAHLAGACGERTARWKELESRFGAPAAEAIAWASQAIPVTVLQRNALRLQAAEFRAELLSAVQAGPSASCEPRIEVADDCAYLAASVHLSQLPAFGAGGAYVQDPTAHAAAALVGAQPGERVLDLCAAPGGKTAAMAIQMQDRGEIVACDVSAERLRRVQENAQRLGLTCIRTSDSPAGARGSGASLGGFDAVLVDVPCTNTGVIARRPEARLALSNSKLRSLVQIQGDLFRTGAAHTRPGGRLIYSTCSLEPEENQQPVEAFLAEHSEWSLAAQQTTLPAWGPGLSSWRDGGFAARLERRSGLSSPPRMSDSGPESG